MLPFTSQNRSAHRKPLSLSFDNANGRFLLLYRVFEGGFSGSIAQKDSKRRVFRTDPASIRMNSYLYNRQKGQIPVFRIGIFSFEFLLTMQNEAWLSVRFDEARIVTGDNRRTVRNLYKIRHDRLESGLLDDGIPVEPIRAETTCFPLNLMSCSR